MVRKTRTADPNWMVLIIILIVAGAAVFLQGYANSISTSGDAIRLSIGSSKSSPPILENTCAQVQGCFTGVGVDGGTTWGFNAYQRAKDDAITACDVAREKELVNCVNMQDEERTACLNSGCQYQGDNPTTTPCEVETCLVLTRINPGIENEEPETGYQCKAGFNIKGMSTCN